MGNAMRKNKSTKEIFEPKEINKNESYIKTQKHLICDDASTNRLVLRKYLNLFGCETDEAENGEDAIDKVRNNGEYAIIWMDIKMPKMDGHECTNYLRNDMKYAGTIIGLTGYVDDITIKKCYSLGMNHVVAKPFDSKIIQNYIEEYKNNNAQ